MLDHIKQRTEIWHQVRQGKVTASRIADVMAQGRSGGVSKTRERYMACLLVQRLGGSAIEEPFKTASIQWGIDQEENARNMYEFYTNSEITEVGFVDHPTIKGTGASPDGLVDSDGLVEIKCPDTHTHFEFLDKGKVPRNYMLQMQW
jgi:putative phage-type endonuclease